MPIVGFISGIVVGLMVGYIIFVDNKDKEEKDDWFSDDLSDDGDWDEG